MQFALLLPVTHGGKCDTAPFSFKKITVLYTMNRHKNMYSCTCCLASSDN